ncbi:MAG TPA: hypothetical protein VMV92_17655 [Streptosporangiaceae bacterium]|nr:hypothetical protein [Streptosporangiaceae bacterium]
MDSLTKTSGVAVSVLVAATASVLLLLPAGPGAHPSRGPAMSPEILVASATAPQRHSPAPPRCRRDWPARTGTLGGSAPRLRELTRRTSGGCRDTAKSAR